MAFSPLPEIFDELRAGRMVILVDDPDRENEGDLVAAAELASAETINFMIRHGSGIVCLTMTNEKADSLHLPLQVAINSSRFGTQFTVTIEAKQGVTTGRLGARPGDDDPHRRPRRLQARGPRAAGPRLPDPRRRGRRAAPVGADRGLRGPVPPRGAEADGRHLRGDERRRDHGARPRPRALPGPARPQDVLGARRHRVAAPARAADPPRHDGAGADAVGRLPAPRLRRAARTPSPTSR